MGIVAGLITDFATGVRPLFLSSQEKGKKEKMLGSQSQDVQQHRQDGVARQAVIQEEHGGFLTFFCYVYYKAESLAHNKSML